jgi:hypothetical protein
LLPQDERLPFGERFDKADIRQHIQLRLGEVDSPAALESPSDLPVKVDYGVFSRSLNYHGAPSCAIRRAEMGELCALGSQRGAPGGGGWATLLSMGRPGTAALMA